MIWAVAFALWITLTAGLYLALSRDVLRCVVGLALLGSAVNLLLLAAGRLGSAQPAVIEAGGRVLQEAANPLPQALVLTAIVIGFALFVFALAVLKRSFELHGNVETDRITAVAEEPAPDLPAPAAAQPATPASGAAAAATTTATAGTKPASPPAALGAGKGAAAGTRT